jgi:hypothetical protein
MNEAVVSVQGSPDGSPPFTEGMLQPAALSKEDVDAIPMEEFHGEVLHYSRPASLHSTTPSETPLRWAPVFAPAANRHLHSCGHPSKIHPCSLSLVIL